MLIDSGGRIWAAPTDITRMVPVGTPTAEQKRDCTTRVEGRDALSRAQFRKASVTSARRHCARADLGRKCGLRSTAPATASVISSMFTKARR